MNNWEEIKQLVEASRRALNKNLVQENNQIKKTYGMLMEQPMEEKNDYEKDKQRVF